MHYLSLQTLKKIFFSKLLIKIFLIRIKVFPYLNKAHGISVCNDLSDKLFRQIQCTPEFGQDDLGSVQVRSNSNLSHDTFRQ